MKNGEWDANGIHTIMSHDANAIANIVRGELAKRHFKEFVKLFWHVVEPEAPFIDGIHVDAIADHLTHVEQIGNLLIAIPPGFGKSLYVSVFFFVWRWLNSPVDRFIYASHSLSLATRDSLKCRRIIESKLFSECYPNQPFKIVEDQNTKTLFNNDKTGFRLSTSIEGSATGERGHFAIADDPHNIKEIESKAKREEVIRWYGDVFSNRVIVNRHSRIVVMQMSHPEDLANHLIANDSAKDWTRLIIPLEGGKARYPSTRWVDPRREGELLCPALMNEKKVRTQRNQMTTRAFSAQYNQHAKGSDSSLFDEANFRTWEAYDKLKCFRIAAVDLALSLKGDYTVVAVADVCLTGEIFLVHVHRERIPSPKLVPTIEAINKVYKPLIIFIEDVAFQRVIIDNCRQKRIPVKGVSPTGDKLSRSTMLQIKFEAGQVFFPPGAKWVEDCKDELIEFPGGKHDDQVDALSYLAIEAQKLIEHPPQWKLPEVPLTPEEKQKKQEDEAKQRYLDMLLEGIF